MDYKRVLRLHYVNNLSSREIADSCGDCGKTAVSEFLKRFKACDSLSYPLAGDVTNEQIEQLLYRKRGVSADQTLYRDFDKDAVCKALTRKGETLKHQWQKYNAMGIIEGKKPLSYRQYCRRYAEWVGSRKITFHIQREPGISIELDFAGKQLCIHTWDGIKKVTVFIAVLTYSDYFYAEGMTECNIQNWIRVNNNALEYFGGVTPTVITDNCKVAVTRNTDWINPVLNKDFQAWADHNNTVIMPAKVKSPRWKPVIEGHVKIINMHILVKMDDMIFHSLEEFNAVLKKLIDEENRKNLSGLNYSRYDLFMNEEKEALLPLPLTKFEYLERKTVKVAQDFSFTFDKVHYTMPVKYLREELEIRAGENEIFVYNKNHDLIRTHKRSYTPKSWVIVPGDMPSEYCDYGYWNVPYFQQKASAVGPNTRIAIDTIIRKYKYPVQSFRSLFGIIRFAEKYSKLALEQCCRDAVAAGKCNYSYISNTVSAYHIPKHKVSEKIVTAPVIEAVTGTYKDNDSQYSLENLLSCQNTEVHNENR